MLPADAHSRYAAWLFDLDGTLYRQSPVRLAMALELLLFGWAALPTLRTFRHAHEEVRALPPSTALDLSPFHRQLEHAAAKLGRPSSDVEQVVREWMFRRPLKWVVRAKRQPLFDALTLYRSKGGKTAVVSDYPATEKVAALGAELFDVVVSSGEPGGPRLLKPDPEGYLSAASRLGVAPADCLVIGDRDDADGGAARAAGMGFQLIR